MSRKIHHQIVKAAPQRTSTSELSGILSALKKEGPVEPSFAGLTLIKPFRHKKICPYNGQGRD